MIIMAGLVFLMTLTESSIVKIDKLFKGPSLTELVKSPMYTTGDTYGKYNSTIEIKCKNYSGKGLDIDGFIIIADSSEYEKIGNMSKSSFRCEILKSFLPNREPLSSGEFEFAIEKTDTFYILLIICSDSSIQLNAEVRSLNPYGYVSADLLPLIPFYFLATISYLLLLLTWTCRLCMFYSNSISIQRIWIPCILVLCILENFFDLSSWLSLNSTGFQNITSQMTAIVIKSFKDALGRVLLMAASRGVGIIQISGDVSNKGLYILGTFYFVFDLSYQIPLKMMQHPELFYLVLLSLPLITLNTVVFYYIFSWFSKTVFRLKFYKQEYKLKLLKQFAVVLGIGGLCSLVWGIVEIIARFFLKRSIWWVNCLYFAVWDLIFFFLVTSLIVVWRVNTNSKLLADTQELRDEDHEISHEDEGKFGIELHRVQKK